MCGAREDHGPAARSEGGWSRMHDDPRTIHLRWKLEGTPGLLAINPVALTLAFHYSRCRMLWLQVPLHVDETRVYLCPSPS